MITKYDQCHKKRYYDLPSIQEKLDIDQAFVDLVWDNQPIMNHLKRWFGKETEPIYLATINGVNYFISTYGE